MRRTYVDMNTNAELQVAFGAAYMGASGKQKNTLRQRYPYINPDQACRAFDLARQRHESAWIKRFADSADELLRAAAETQRQRQKQNAERNAERKKRKHARHQAAVEAETALRARREAAFAAMCIAGPLPEPITLTLEQEQERLAFLQRYCLTGRMTGIVEALREIGVHRACSKKAVCAMFFFLEAPDRPIGGIESAAEHLGISFDNAAALIAKVIRAFPALREPTEWIETPFDAARRIMSTARDDQ